MASSGADSQTVVKVSLASDGIKSDSMLTNQQQLAISNNNNSNNYDKKQWVPFLLR
jgi:hypothetical protein